MAKPITRFRKLIPEEAAKCRNISVGIESMFPINDDMARIH